MNEDIFVFTIALLTAIAMGIIIYYILKRKG